MSNQAAKEVTASLLGKDFKTIILAGKAYTLYPATIKTICKGLYHWADLLFNSENQTPVSVISQIPMNAPQIIRGLSVFIVGDVKYQNWKARMLYRKLKKGTPSITNEEMNKAVLLVIDLIHAQHFFDCALSVKSVTKMAGTQK